MIYVFLGYYYSPGFDTPQSWINRIAPYAGMPECLSETDTVYYIKQIDYVGEYVHKDVNYRFVNLNREKTHFPYRIHKYVKKLKPDVVIINGLQHPLEIMQLRLILGKKVRIIIQHRAERPGNGIKKYINRVSDKSINAYLFASKQMGDEWQSSGNISRADKIHELMPVSSVFAPVNRQAALSKTGVNGQPSYLWIGNLDSNKDPLMAIKSFLRYLEIHPAAKLYLIYQTNNLLPAIKQLLDAALHCRKNIILIGKVPHNELLYWFNSADFIISTSHYESGGAAVCEAMSCGCIPVITDIPSFRMITDNGNCGILYEAGKEDALFCALQKSRQIDVQQKRAEVLTHYNATLSFKAITTRFKAIVEGLTA
ncbi:glycosyltransferase family 4 protein [Mucilaginibacter mali]|uniref:Glycosyltransferase family 4 protein n=1 Tax=Mucilaginibacter mali TaxID=2740462 RepID=A0A7D4TNI7_9SPHI|nr:glycosyltransferase family 4 protein [Mucilaginibacter mali]QKJ29914.1 glycosyltransferase family 4 protein [Mucilaginibacter mali]